MIVNILHRQYNTICVQPQKGKLYTLHNYVVLTYKMQKCFYLETKNILLSASKLKHSYSENKRTNNLIVTPHVPPDIKC